MRPTRTRCVLRRRRAKSAEACASRGGRLPAIRCWTATSGACARRCSRHSPPRVGAGGRRAVGECRAELARPAAVELGGALRRAARQAVADSIRLSSTRSARRSPIRAGPAARDLQAHAVLPPGAVLVQEARFHRHADHEPAAACGRSSGRRADRHQRQARRRHARDLDPLSQPVRPHRPSRRERAVRLRRRACRPGSRLSGAGTRRCQYSSLPRVA